MEVFLIDGYLLSLELIYHRLLEESGVDYASGIPGTFGIETWTYRDSLLVNEAVYRKVQTFRPMINTIGKFVNS